jgi:predicted GNAT superfamily acetyltransferase
VSTSDAIEVRALKGHAEFAQAVELQRAVWQFEELELLPVRLFVVAEKVGGQALGAFKNGCLIGFCLAIPGIRDGEIYLHSHMLGVLPEFRNAGVGRALKMAQREDALARGLKFIEWTFDPLELKNAHFNIERLGAIALRYVLNQYGSTTSPLHGGLPTDRCTAQWWIRSQRVQTAIAQQQISSSGNVLGRVSVPADIDDIKQRDALRARDIQARVSGEFQEMLSKGYAAIGFERTADAGVYLFGPWPSE